ncbi:MAG: hypothetical protein JWR26_1508 [Pedosphaera sp.]|nr:hypothetical protein [Pedosphaera sp.]
MHPSLNTGNKQPLLQRLSASVTTVALACMFALFFPSSPLLAAATELETEEADLEKTSQRWMLLSLIVILLAIVPFYLRMKKRQQPPRK